MLLIDWNKINSSRKVTSHVPVNKIHENYLSILAEHPGNPKKQNRYSADGAVGEIKYDTR